MSAAKRARKERNGPTTIPVMPGAKALGIAAEVSKSRLSPDDALQAFTRPFFYGMTEVDFPRLLLGLLKPGHYEWAPRKQAPTFEKDKLPSFGSSVGVTAAGLRAGVTVVPETFTTYVFPKMKQGGISFCADIEQAGVKIRCHVSCFHFPSGSSNGAKRAQAARFLVDDVAVNAAACSANVMLGFADFNADIKGAEREEMFTILEEAGFGIPSPPTLSNDDLRNDFKCRCRRRKDDPPEGIKETVSKFGDGFFVKPLHSIKEWHCVRFLLPPAEFPTKIGAADWYSDHKAQFCVIRMAVEKPGSADASVYIPIGGQNVLAARMSDEIRSLGGMIAPLVEGRTDGQSLSAVGTTREFTYDAVGVCGEEETTWPYMLCPYTLDPAATSDGIVTALTKLTHENEHSLYADVYKCSKDEARQRFISRKVWTIDEN